MEKAYIQTEEHLNVDKDVMKALHDLEIDPKKKKMDIKDIIALAKKVGYAISPSQATEALFCAKGDVDKFKTPFTEDELQRLVKWFYESRPILRLASKNYMKIDRTQYNNSVNMKPNISMINAPIFDRNSMSGSTTPKVITPFSPNKSGMNFTNSHIDENMMRSKIRQTIDNIERLPKIK